MIKPDTNNVTENLLNDISDFYKTGLALYNQKKYAEAEKTLANILKFTFNANIITKLYFTRESEIIVDTVYHLGSIYEKRSDIDCNYSKAAAIFQYGYRLACKNFDSMYQVHYASEVTSNKLYDYRNKFLDKVNNIEQIFLHEAKSQLGISNNNVPIIVPIGIERSFFNLAKEKLIDLRVKIKHEIENIDKDHIAIEERSRKIQEIYSNINKFFANDQESGLIQQLFQDCEFQLGNPPYKYAVITLGSLSIGMMTPWSDFEFAILIEEESNKEYFRILTELMHIKIINFGETHLRSVGIESLNNFKTGKKEDDWFWDQVIESGLSFDGPQWHACKTPVGRKGYKKIVEEKNDFEQEGIQLISIPDYELILTPKQLAEYQLSSGKNKDVGFDSDKYFLQSLRSAGLLYGDQNLLNEYRNLLRCQEKSIVREREIQILKEDLSKYDLELHKNKDGNLINVKTIYRLPERITVFLANYNFIILEDGHKSINAWKMLDKMWEKQLISLDLKLSLQQALTITAEFRLKSYCYNGAQIEKISICDPAIVTHFDNNKKLALKNKTLIVKNTDLLGDFYFTIALIKNSIGKLLCSESPDINGIDSINKGFLSENMNLRNQVHTRFLEYDKAIGCAEEKKDSNEESKLQNFYIWLNALKVYVAKCDIDKAQNIADKLLAFIKETKSLHDSYYDIYVADTYRQIGIMYFNNNSYEKAIEYHKKEYGIYLNANEAPENIRIFTCCMHIANLYFKLEQYDQAIYYFCSGQNISQDIDSRPHCLLQFFTISGYIHKIYGEAEQARDYFNEALNSLQQIEQDNPSHPTVFTIYEHIADLLYSNNKHFKSAVYFRDAIDLLLQFNNKQDFCNKHIARILIKLGNIDQDLQFDERACEYYFAAINYMQNDEQLFVGSQPLARMYYKLAFSAYYVGQIYAAIEYYNRAINILIKGSDYCDPNVINTYNEIESNYYNIDQDMIDIYSNLVTKYLDLAKTNDVTEDIFEKNAKAVINYSRGLLILLKVQSPKNYQKIDHIENIVHKFAEPSSYGTNNTVQNVIAEQDVLGLNQLLGECETPFVSINSDQF